MYLLMSTALVHPTISASNPPSSAPASCRCRTHTSSSTSPRSPPNPAARRPRPTRRTAASRRYALPAAHRTAGHRRVFARRLAARGRVLYKARVGRQERCVRAVAGTIVATMPLPERRILQLVQLSFVLRERLWYRRLHHSLVPFSDEGKTELTSGKSTEKALMFMP